MSSAYGDIDQIISPQAFENVEKMITLMGELDKAYKQTFGDIIKGMGELNKASGAGNTSKGIEGLNAKTKEATQLQTAYEKQLKASQDQLAKLQAQIALLNSEQQKSVNIAKDVKTLRETEAKANNAAAGSLEQMRAQLKSLELQYARIKNIEGEGAATAAELVKQHKELYSVVSKHEQNLGNFSRQVGNYAKGFNAMNIAVSQLVREMPNFAQSFQIGIMSLSNNWAGLQDAITMAKAKNAELVADGKASIPIWKQVGSAVISWNTAIMVGVTALQYLAPAIAKWWDELGKVNNGLKNLKTQYELNNIIQKEAEKNTITEITRLKLLKDVIADTNQPMEKRVTAIQAAQKEFPEYLGNLSKEKMLANDVGDAYTKAANGILAKAKAQAAQKEIEKLALDLLNLEKFQPANPSKLDPLAAENKNAYALWNAHQKAKQNILNQMEYYEKFIITNTNDFRLSEDKKTNDRIKGVREKDVQDKTFNEKAFTKALLKELIERSKAEEDWHKALQESLETDADTWNKYLKNQEDAYDAFWKGLVEAAIKGAKDIADKKKKEKQDKQDAIGSIIGSGVDITQSGIDAYMNMLNQKYETEFALIDKKKELELDALDRMTMSEEKRAEKKKQIELAAEERRKKIHNEQIRDQRRAEIFKRSLDIAQIIRNTAIAATADLANPLQVAADIAFGAAQIAQIMATPLPQYAKGRQGGKAEFAEVNERGAEIVVNRDGSAYVPNEGKRGVTFLQEGASVIPHDRIKEAAFMKLARNNNPVTPSSYADAMIAAAVEDSADRITAAIKKQNLKVAFYGDMGYSIRRKQAGFRD